MSVEYKSSQYSEKQKTTTIHIPPVLLLPVLMI